MQYKRIAPKLWMKGILFLASITSLVSGIQYLLFPGFIFKLAGLPIPGYNFIWQSLGALDILFAATFMITAFNIYRHWVSILLVLLFKLFSTAIFLNDAIEQPELWNMSNYIFIDNILWLIPLTAVLVGVYKYSSAVDNILINLYSSDFGEFSLDMFETNEDENLLELSEKQPVMLVFLRHFGCTFCRESIKDISEIRGEIESKGTKIIVVHMLEDENSALEQLEKYGLPDVSAISDPECILYKMFKLRRGTLLQLIGPKVIFRGIVAGIFKGLGIGPEKGDLHQMPGVFLLHKGKIIKQFVHKSAADRPNYLEIATFDQ